MTQYYTYVLTNSLDNQPFYVGKGSGSRMYQHLKEAQRDDYTKRSVHYKINSIIQNGGHITYQKMTWQTEEQAFNEEKRLISLYGRKDLGTGPLCNLTDGGEGQHQSPESVERRAAKHRGMKRSVESRARMKEAQKAITQRNLEAWGQKKDPVAEGKRVAKRIGVPWSANARSIKRDKPTAKPVLAYHKDTNVLVGRWESTALCARELGCDSSAVWKICEGGFQMKSTKGYTFTYESA